MNVEQDYCHQVVFNDRDKVIRIERVFLDGSRHLFTILDVAINSEESVEEAFRRCSQRLGEDLLLDSPRARKMFDL